MSDPTLRDATMHSLATAIGSALCLVLAEWIGLRHANLAVWTTFLVMAQYGFTSFQKGLERILGRGLGILAGLVLTTWFNETPLVLFVLIGVLLSSFLYLYFAGWMAYTFLQAGLYVVAVFQIGHADPTHAVGASEELFAAIVLGVAVADVVNWLGGVERDIGMKLTGSPLWPLRREWVSQSLMLSVTVLFTLVAARAIDLPAESAAISVLVLTVSPHLQALIQKGKLRIVGLALATIWSLVTFAVIGLVPYFPVLVVLIFLGLFVANYLTLTAGSYAYAGLQMGLVLPMVVVAGPSLFGSIEPAINRLAGILMGLTVSVIVATLWPRFPMAEQPAPAPAPSSPSPQVTTSAMPGEIDV